MLAMTSMDTSCHFYIYVMSV